MKSIMHFLHDVEAGNMIIRKEQKYNKILHLEAVRTVRLPYIRQGIPG
jgi:hypothetical protein